MQQKNLEGWQAAGRFHRRLFRLAIHDLSNPLAAARLLAELQRRGAGSPSDQADLADQLGRAAGLLGALRNLFREGEAELVATRRVAEDVLSLASSEALRVSARLLLGHVDDLWVKAPRHRLLQTLILGTLSSLDQGGADVVLVLSQASEGEEAIFSLEVAGKPDSPLPADEIWAFRQMVDELGGLLQVMPGERLARDPAWRFSLARAEPPKA